MRPDPFDRLETAAEAVVRRAEDARGRVIYEQGNRLSLLWVHAVVALVAGLQMCAYGTATTIETVAGPHARLVMGPLALVGGAALAFGLTRKPRSVRWEGYGLVLIGLWDALMALALSYARLSQHEYRLIGINEPLPTGYASAYPITVYAGLFALVVVHLLTLRKLRKAREETSRARRRR